VARIAEAQGHKVIALAVGTEIAHRLGDDLKVPSASVAAFIGRHRALLDPAARSTFASDHLRSLAARWCWWTRPRRSDRVRRLISC
jgi:hypothetical protein